MKSKNRLTPLAMEKVMLSRVSREKITFVLCECSCGNVCWKPKRNLASKSVKSCGCIGVRGPKTHGQTDTKIYKVWRAMRERCNNKRNPRFSDYGGRGIFVCAEWDDFLRFKSDMGERPEGYSLDRIDNDLGYSKENCRWATPKQQANNRRNNVNRSI